MYTWNLSTILTEPLDPEWEKLSRITLGDKVHSDRKHSFLLSRIALKKCLADFGKDLSPAQLILKNFHEIKDLGSFTVSLSHTKKAGAALVSDRHLHRSVGIDIEEEERIVKDSIRQKVQNRDDIKLRNIELWCLKEAAYKALMNSQLLSESVDFSTIVIGNNRWSHSPSRLEGLWELEFVKPFVVARAFLRN